MLKQPALVTKVMNGKVEVEVAIESSCSGCNAADTCGVGTVAKAFSGQTQHLIVNTDRIVAVGQWITIATQESNLLNLAAITYLLPLFGLLVTGLIAQQIFTSEGPAIIASLIGGYGLHLIAKHLIKLREKKLPTISIV
ncbi:MAG: SoxR reducing system RseC family protein [Gammaproteobacteria bacterium]|nr:SoxR reducing system RseC family protein [Gammaproteobacteria bacterium]